MNKLIDYLFISICFVYFQIQFLRSHILSNQTTSANTVVGTKGSPSVNNSSSSSSFFSLADAFNSASQAKPNVAAATDPFLNYIHSLVRLVDTFPAKRSTAKPFKYAEPITPKSANVGTGNGFRPKVSINMNKRHNGVNINATNAPIVVVNRHVPTVSQNRSTAGYNVIQNGTTIPTVKPKATPALTVTKPMQAVVSLNNSSGNVTYKIAPRNISHNAPVVISSTINGPQHVDITTQSINVAQQGRIQTTVAAHNDFFALFGLDKGRMDNLSTSQHNGPTTMSQYVLQQQEQAITYSPFLKPLKREHHANKINVHVVPIQQIVKTTDIGTNFVPSYQPHTAHTGYVMPVMSEFVDKSHATKHMAGGVNVRPVPIDRHHGMVISTSIDPFVRFQNGLKQNESTGYSVDTFGKPHHRHHGEIQILSLDNTVTRPTILHRSTDTYISANNTSNVSNRTVEIMVNGTNTNSTLPFWLSLLNTNDKGIIRGKDEFVSYVGKPASVKQLNVSKNIIHAVDSLPPGLTLLSAGRTQRVHSLIKDTTTPMYNHSNNSGVNYSLPETLMAGTGFNIVHSERKDQHVQHMTHDRKHSTHSNGMKRVFKKAKARVNGAVNMHLSTQAPALISSTFTPSWLPEVNNSMRWNLFIGTPDSVSRKQPINHTAGHQSEGHGHRNNLFPPTHAQNHSELLENRTVLFPPKAPEHSMTHDIHASHSSGRSKLFPPSENANTVHGKHLQSNHAAAARPQDHSQIHHSASHVPQLSFGHPQSRLTSHPKNGNIRRNWQHIGRSAARPLPVAKRNLWQPAHTAHVQHDMTKGKSVDNLQSHSSHITGNTNINQFNHAVHTSNEGSQHNMHSGNGHRVHMTNLQIHNQHPQSRNRLFDHVQPITTAAPMEMNHNAHAGHGVPHRLTTATTILEMLEANTTTSIPMTTRPETTTVISNISISSTPTIESTTTLSLLNQTTEASQVQVLKNNTIMKALKERYYKEIMKRLLFRRLMQRKHLDGGHNVTEHAQHSANQHSSVLPDTTAVPPITKVPMYVPAKIRPQTTEIFELLQSFVMQNTSASDAVKTKNQTTPVPVIVSTETIFNFELMTTSAPMLAFGPVETTTHSTPTPMPLTTFSTLFSTAAKGFPLDHNSSAVGHQQLNMSAHHEPKISSNNLTTDGMHKLMRTLSLIRALRKANLVTENKDKNLITVDIAALRKAYAKLKTMKSNTTQHNEKLNQSQTTATPLASAHNVSDGVAALEKQVTMSALGINTMSPSLGLFETQHSRSVRRQPVHRAPLANVVTTHRTARSRNTRVRQGRVSQTTMPMDLPVPALREIVQYGPSRRRLDSQNQVTYRHSLNNNGIVSRRPVPSKQTTGLPTYTETFTLDHFADIFADVATTNYGKDNPKNPLPVYNQIGTNTVRRPIVSQSNVRPIIPQKQQVRDQILADSHNARPIKHKPVIQQVVNAMDTLVQEPVMNIVRRQHVGNTMDTRVQKPAMNIVKRQHVGNTMDTHVQNPAAVPSRTITVNGPGNRKLVFVRKHSAVRPTRNDKPILKKVKSPAPVTAPVPTVKVNPVRRTQNLKRKRNTRNNQHMRRRQSIGRRPNMHRINRNRLSNKPRKTNPHSRNIARGKPRSRVQMNRRNLARNHRRNGRKGVGVIRVKTPNNPDKLIRIRNNNNQGKKNPPTKINIRRILSRLYHGYDYGNGHGNGNGNVNANANANNIDYYNPNGYKDTRNNQFSGNNNVMQTQPPQTAEQQEQASERAEAMEEANEARENGDFDGQRPFNRRMYKRSVSNQSADKSFQRIDRYLTLV